jgi:hypothetical protein
MNGPDVFRGHDYSKLQMSGMHLRKVVRALIRLRRERGTLAGSAAALTMVTVDIAAAITGARLSVSTFDLTRPSSPGLPRKPYAR